MIMILLTPINLSMKGEMESMRWVKTAIGAVIAISVIPMIVTTVSDLTGTGKVLDGKLAGTLLDLSPVVFVAGVLGYLFLRTGTAKND